MLQPCGEVLVEVEEDNKKEKDDAAGTSVLRMHMDWAKWCLSITLPSLLYSAASTCSAVQCSAVQCSAVQCSAVQCTELELIWNVLLVPRWSRSWHRQAITWEGLTGGEGE
jgi:hypothetical protein